VKSGDEIVSQLFHFQSREDKSGNTESFALRPEYTPTLARMIAAKASSLPRPIKWFSIPRCYRAERQQKGRLKEFFQWNADILGGETPETRRQFDLEIAAVCLDCLRELGLASTDIQLLWNDRTLVEQLFTLAGVPAERFAFAFYLLDRIAKLAPEPRKKLYEENALTDRERAFFEKLANKQDPLQASFWSDGAGGEGGADGAAGFEAYAATIAATQAHLEKNLALMGLAGYAKYDASIVRGLAYYTGFVFEVADAQGENRAIAGGGRYDKLIEMFGGPGGGLPAVGFGMGDVVIAILLQELGKLPAEASRTIPDVFVINALPTNEEAMQLISELRRSTWDPASRRVLPRNEGLLVATSYKTTKNVGKLLTEASASGAPFAVLLAPAEWSRGIAKLKNLATREESELPTAELATAVRARIRPH
jgi:histidyl-tRNA synthetase